VAPDAGAGPALNAGDNAASNAVLGTNEDELNTLDEEARQRFELGRTFYEAGRFKQAAEEFAEAYRLSGRPQLLYNLYVANRDAADWQAAIEALRGYLAMVPDAPDRINLRARLASMEAQAARMREQEVRDERERTVALSPTPPVERQRSIVPWLLMGSGGALVVSSLVTGSIAKSKDGDVDEACMDGGKVCEEWTRDDATKAYALAVTTDVLWATGAAAAVTGLVLWLTGALDKEQQVPALSIGASSRAVSTSLRFRY
jgi:tetratricopeptide (TPR) repeat protein